MECPDDLSQLADFSEDNVTKVVKTRYKEDRIYTNVGEILLAVNPCKELTIYTESTKKQYDWGNFEAKPPPHVFDIATRAYRRMLQAGGNQIILVCGESGAGKTESAKYMVEHLMYMVGHGTKNLNERIVKINTILETFGNARTKMNHNSSRFAKFLQLSFGEDGQVIGAIVRDYMLEKCRVVARIPNCHEGNFHIFYAMFAGLSEKEKRDLYLQRQETYEILKGSAENLKSEVKEEYRRRYESIRQILTQIGMKEDEQRIMKKMLAAILHLSEIKFDVVKGSVKIKDKEYLKQAADLLEVQPEDLNDGLLEKSKPAGDFPDCAILSEEQIPYQPYQCSNNTQTEAEVNRDALVKHTYDRLFGWVVKKINDNLHPNRKSHRNNEMKDIGILDIPGFEKLQDNKFEQLCINFVNEQLQVSMNRILVEEEQRIYQSEGINVGIGDISKGETCVVDIFEMRSKGLWSTLDDTTKLPFGDDREFVEKLQSNAKDFDKHHILKFTRGRETKFSIQHFAGEIWYNCENILEKNRDKLTEGLEEKMKKSREKVIRSLFSADKSITGTFSVTLAMEQFSSKEMVFEKQNHIGKKGIHGPKSHKTVVNYYRESVKELNRKLKEATPHFVRCIKPNEELRQDHFDAPFVGKQLKYNGIYELSKYRKNGFPVRMKFKDFFDRYKIILPSNHTNEAGDDIAAMIDGLLNSQPELKLNGCFKVGKYMVFMKEELSNFIEKLLKEEEDRRKREREKKLMEERRKREREKKLMEERKQRAKIEEEEKLRREREEMKTEQNSDTNRETRETGESEDEEVKPKEKLGLSTPIHIEAECIRLSSSNSERVRSKDRQKSQGNEEIQLEAIEEDTEPTADNNQNSEEETNDEDGNERRDDKRPSPSTDKKEVWDTFQIMDKENQRVDVHTHTSFRIIKILLYMFLFLILLASLVIQKISLLIATSKLKKINPANATGNDTIENEISNPGVHSLLLVFVICTPYVMTFLASCWKVFFGNIKRPSLTTILMCAGIEVLHSIGLCVLVFKLLPDLGSVQRICLLSATVLLPSVFKLFSNRESQSLKNRGKLGKLMIIIFDILAIVMQLSAILFLLLPFFKFKPESNKPGNSNKTQVLDNGIFSELSTDLSWYFKVLLSLLLCSVSWWENFVLEKACCRKVAEQSILKIRDDLQERRPYIYIIVSFLKTATTVFFARLLVGEYMGLLKGEFWSKVTDYKNVTLFSDIIALIVSSFVGYYTAYTSCKLQMQRISFSLPCLLSTPVFIAVLTYYCKTGEDFISLFSTNKIDSNCDNEMFGNRMHVLISAVWLLSLYWVGQHIWFPSQERLAKATRLFVNPLYCGILLEQHLVMNRRRKQQKINKKGKNENNKECVYMPEMDSNQVPEMDSNQVVLKEETNTNEKNHPVVYACATMWHETRFEMVQLLKSLFRLDKDQFDREVEYQSAKEENKNDPNKTNLPEDYYEFEAHILFDDAFNENGNVNHYVETFESVIKESASAVHKKLCPIEKPFLLNTIYGGQVIYRMPGGNLMFIHLKDKSKIRHKKRWSQVMYMYYLLGYRFMTAEISHKVKEEDKEKTTSAESESLNDFDTKADNTFLLALDGDVDFTPGSVRLLIDRMRKDDRVGAACGRIHPIGSGPIVWYQKFEYAVAHWLQKATEHVLGCVLCSPGCFSLFRGSALMDDNVMKKYTLLPSEASHHLMYDQGEDRWLCTLLLQQGYRVDYAAGADAFTYAPEKFNEYFNQRKRWGPSTLANIMSLLQNSKNTVKNNSNISWLYIFYQASLMAATFIGPATILMMIAGAFVAVFGVDLITSYIASLVPAVLYFIICVTCSTKIQLVVAQILSGLYVIIMMVVLVGVIITAVTESPYHPSVVFLVGIVAIFVFAAMCHPREWSNLIFGFLYFILVPSGFLILIIYSLCNLNDVSWGTRESSTPNANVKQKKSVLSKILYPFKKLRQSLSSSRNSEKDALYINMLKSMTDVMEQSKSMRKRTSSEGDLREVIVDTDVKKEQKETVNKKAETKKHNTVKKVRGNKTSGPGWIENCRFPGICTEMKEEETIFWRKFIKEYLKPLEKDEDKEKKVKEELRELRNNVCGGMALINLIWISVNFMFQLRKPTVVTFVKLENGEEIKTDVLGLLFIIFFTLILVIQFCGMIMHRWGTFLHLVAITEIPNPFKKKQKDNLAESINQVSEDDENFKTSEEERIKGEEDLEQIIFSLQKTGKYKRESFEIPTSSTKKNDLNSTAATESYKNTNKNEEGKRVRFAETKRNLRETIMARTETENSIPDRQQGGNLPLLRGGLMHRRLQLSRSKREA